MTDLIEEAGGLLEHIEALEMESDTQAKVTLRIPSAMALSKYPCLHSVCRTTRFQTRNSWKCG